MAGFHVPEYVVLPEVLLEKDTLIGLGGVIPVPRGVILNCTYPFDDMPDTDEAGTTAVMVMGSPVMVR